MPINPNVPAVGLAEFNSDTVGALVELFAGDTPQPVTQSGTYTAAQAIEGIPANTPVSLDVETGAIELVDGTTITKANAVTVGVLRPVASPGATGRMAVYKAGNFNINALNWTAEQNTEALRLAAFDMAECQIYVTKPYYS